MAESEMQDLQSKPTTRVRSATGIWSLVDKDSLDPSVIAQLEKHTFGVLPPKGSYNLYSHLGALILTTPAVLIGFLDNVDNDDDAEIDMDESTPYTRVLIPGIVWILFGYLLTSMLRFWFGQDLLEEKSNDTDVRETMRSNLTNTGVVGALFLTVVLAMMQADAPNENTARLLCQWYQIFLLTGLFCFFLSTMMASLLLMYIEPLDQIAGLVFVQNNLDYFGEPVPALLFGIINVGYAGIVWMFGVYGRACGIICGLAIYFCLQRVFLTALYLSNWSNPFITKADRKQNLSLAAAEEGTEAAQVWEGNCCLRFLSMFQPGQSG